MKTPFQTPAPTIHEGRNAFDRSSKSVFSAAIGELLPFFTMDCLGGSKVKLSNRSFSRTLPVNTAAFSRLSENFDYFFVPYRLLWSYWNAFRTNISDENSTIMNAYGNQHVYSADAVEQAADPKLPHEVPLFSYNELFAHFNNTSDFRSDPDVGGSGTRIPEDYEERPNVFGFDTKYGAYKLFNLLGYGELDRSRILPNELLVKFDLLHDYWFNPFRICAYQKICYDHYRLTEFQPNNPFAYNVDFWSIDNTRISKDAFDLMFELHYRPLKKDYFTGVRPYTYWFGQTNPNGNWDVALTIPNSFYAKQSNPVGFNLEDFKNQDLPVSAQSLYGAQNAQSIRLAFIMERLQRVQALTPKHYDQQFEALFGFKPKDGINESVRIGSFNNTILIDEVTANVTTNETIKGSIAGKGISMSSDRNEEIEFTCPEDGVILGIYSVSPISDYNSSGVDPFNTKSINTDYYNPIFDDLGPHVIRTMNYQFVPGANDLNNNVLGLQTPYLEYKTGLDKVYGQFQTGGVFSEWVSPRFAQINPNNPDFDFDYLRNLDVSYLLVNPRDYDSIFAMHHNGQDYTDQLLVNGYTSAKVIQNMSVSGEPYGLI